ncbi:MAG: hypothetical protein AB1657_04610 [Candidatus Micrarchaeota archaeon]
MRAKVLYNKTKDWAVKTAKEVSEFLKSAKVQQVEKGADFTIVIGGDGTILYHKNELEGAIFGVGSERSYVCQSRQENWREKLRSFLKNPRAEERILLSVSMEGKEIGFAINDAAFLSRDHNMLHISISVDGGSCTFPADGLIISTPTGSTAYCYSAGGVKLDAPLDAVELVPIAPFKHCFDPMVVSAQREIRVSTEEPCHLLIDGQQLIQLKEKTPAAIRKHKRKIAFAEVP